MIYNRDGIIKNLKNKHVGKEIIFLNETYSTNDDCKDYGSNGYDSGTVVIAVQQTKGKGRMGRSWYSPPNGGIYMSLLIRPNLPLDKSFLLTFIAALSVRNAIEDIVNINPEIKWPNDIIINNKKVCGILTELKIINQDIDYAVIGIGVNVNTSEFDRSLEDVAVSLKHCCGGDVERGLLVVKILEEYEKYYNMLLQKKEAGILEEYKNKCFTIGSYVKVNYKGKNVEGYGADVDSTGNLIVETKDNKVLNISSGEATLKGFKGYLGF